MKGRRTIPTLLLGLTSLVGSGTASANFIVNGDFATGNLTGWTAAAIDRNGNPTTPLISVSSLGAMQDAVFDTGTFATGPHISTLSQSFTVTAAEPILSFNLNNLPTLTADRSGPGTGSFLDSFVASVDDGTTTYTLLLADSTGAQTDPFGTAPGLVAIGTSSGYPLNRTFFADLASLAGSTVTLFLDVSNEDDGFRSVFSATNFQTSAQPPSNFTIPEPRSLLLLGLGALGLFGYGWRQRE